MATHFKTKATRTIVLSAILGYAIDVVVILFATIILAPQTTGPLFWALLLPIVIYVLQLLLLAYGVLKRYVYYKFFEKEARIQSTLDEFIDLRLPAPEGAYGSVEEYLSDAAMNPAVSDQARFNCAFTLGAPVVAKATGATLRSNPLQRRP